MISLLLLLTLSQCPCQETIGIDDLTGLWHVSTSVGAGYNDVWLFFPDGLFLFTGTMFAPTEDRDVAGEGFTHKKGDLVTIANPALGALINTVGLSTEIPPWTFGATTLMQNLAARGLLK